MLTARAIKAGLVVLLGAAVNVQAQQGDTLSARILNVQEYNPTISDARKIAATPQPTAADVKPLEVNYVFEPMPLDVSYKPDTIVPANVKPEPLEPLYRAHLLAGAGNGLNYMAEAYVNTLRMRDSEAGLWLNHRSTDGNLRAGKNEAFIQPAPFQHTEIGAHGKRFTKHHALGGALGYIRDRIQYYGFSDSNGYSVFLPEGALARTYHRLGADAHLKSFYTDSSLINHEVTLSYDRFADGSGANGEHNFVANAVARRYMGAHELNLAALADVNVNSVAAPYYHPEFDSVLAQSNGNTILGMTGYATSRWLNNDLVVSYGGKLQWLTGPSTVRIYPYLNASYKLVGEVLIPYFGLDGGYRRNTMQQLVGENPFLLPERTPLVPTDVVIDAFGGFRGAISSSVGYSLRGSIKDEYDTPLMVNYNASAFNPALALFGENYFTVTYDTLRIQRISGELSYNDGPWHAVLGGQFSHYRTRREAAAWHRPRFEAQGLVKYQLTAHIALKATVFVTSARQVKRMGAYSATDSSSVASQEVDGRLYSVFSETLKPIVDINIGAEYRYTERIGAFVQINNMAAQRYSYWNGYVNQRLNVLAGISYSLWRE